MNFGTCRVCSHPFPILVEGTKEDRCPPCRKRETGTPLTKSDLAFDAIHAYYSDLWNDLDSRDVQNIDEIERLKVQIRMLEENLEGMKTSHDAARRGGNETELLRRQVRALTVEKEQLSQFNRQLQADVRQLQADLNRAAFRDLFGRPIPQVEGLDRETVKNLLKLCHPDKHGGNDELANDMTKKLLDLRRNLPKR